MIIMQHFSSSSIVVGVQTIAYAFPKVKIITAACDTELDPLTGFICPGLGNFGDRYFGTDSHSYISDSDDAVFHPSSLTCVAQSPSAESLKSFHSLDSNLSPSVAVKSFNHDSVFNDI